MINCFIVLEVAGEKISSVHWCNMNIMKQAILISSNFVIYFCLQLYENT
jgi:hypothetical protein